MAENLEAGGQTLRIFVPQEIVNLTPDLQRFFDAMIYKLRRNKHKGRWEDMSLTECFVRLQEEILELDTAIQEGSTVEMTFEAADVANFALIIANVALESRPHRTGTAVTLGGAPKTPPANRPPEALRRYEESKNSSMPPIKPPPGYGNTGTSGPIPDDIHTAYEERRGGGKDVV